MGFSTFKRVNQTEFEDRMPHSEVIKSEDEGCEILTNNALTCARLRVRKVLSASEHACTGCRRRDVIFGRVNRSQSVLGGGNGNGSRRHEDRRMSHRSSNIRHGRRLMGGNNRCRVVH